MSVADLKKLEEQKEVTQFVREKIKVNPCPVYYYFICIFKIKFCIITFLRELKRVYFFYLFTFQNSFDITTKRLTRCWYI